MTTHIDKNTCKNGLENSYLKLMYILLQVDILNGTLIYTD